MLLASVLLEAVCLRLDPKRTLSNSSLCRAGAGSRGRIVRPLAVQSIRATLRGGLAEAVVKATEHELAEQSRLRKTQDFGEGIKAMSERRPPVFTGE